MSHPLLPPQLLAGVPAPSRRSFLRYTGASAVVGSLWLAGCKKDEPQAAAPTIASFSPGSGTPGSTVTVTGTNFSGVTSVTVGGMAAQFTVVSATSLTLVVPTGAGTGSIAIVTPGGTATSSTSFTVTAATSSAPTITSFAPASAQPDTAVTVTGTNFTGASSVTVNGLPAMFQVNIATVLMLQVPTAAAPGLATVVVTTPSGAATNNTDFTVLPTVVNLGTGDAGVLNYAYALEQLEAAFYTQLRTGNYYFGLSATSAEKQILDDLHYHEVIHREFFKVVLGSNAIKSLTLDFSSVDFNSRAAVLAAAKAFEDLGVAAYNGAGQYITAPAYLYLAGKIVSVEARHAALIRDLISENTFVGSDILTSSSLERSMLPNDVVTIANNYLANGSKLAPPGTF